MGTKTLYTCTFGDYWKKYGMKWLDAVDALNNKPDEIFVVSDKRLLDCPHKVIIADPNKVPYAINLFRQTALDNTSCDWYCPSDIDDIMLPNYLDNIDDAYDIHTVWMAFTDKNKNDILTWKNDSKFIWKNMFDLKKVPFPTRAFVKTNLAKKIGYSKYGYEDYAFWLMFRSFMPNAKINYDFEEKFIYTYHPDETSLTSISRDEKRKQSIEIRDLLKSGTKHYEIQNVKEGL